MVENLSLLQKYLMFVVYAEELDDIFENLIFVEFVLEKKQIMENYQGLENQAGKILVINYL